MSRKHFNISFPSDLLNVKTIIVNTVDFIRFNLLSADENDLYDLRLVYSELLCNAVVHGNKNDAHKRVNLTVELLENMVFSMIKDEGNGFDHENLVTEALTNDDLYKDRGRGILLVHSLTDSMSFNVTGNEIKFSKKVNLHG